MQKVKTKFTNLIRYLLMRIVLEVLWGKNAQVDRPGICQELLAPYKHPQVRESVVVDDMEQIQYLMYLSLCSISSELLAVHHDIT